MPMLYTDEIQETLIREKMRLLITAIAESIGDNDEAADVRERTPDRLEYQDGFEFVAPCHLGFYWSSGTGTPMIDGLIERLIKSQAEEWAREYPNLLGMEEILTGDDEGEFRSEAEEWEQAAFEDEVIFIRVEIINDHGDIKLRSCFMNEINIPYGEELQVTLDESAFLALDGEELEALATRIAEAPYLDVVTKLNSGGRWHGWFGTQNGETAYFQTGGHESEDAARKAVSRAMRPY
jgi:hypothetical protein